MASRSYPAGTVEALIALSHRTCYYPSCGVPIIVLVDRRPRMNIDVAHIEALNEGGARYRAEMDDRQRNAFDNLILLCRPHHKHVDEDEERFPVPVLVQWKKVIEQNVGAGQLDVFEGMTEEKLEGVISSVIDQHAGTVRSALGELRAMGTKNGAMLANVLARLDDVQLAGGYLDADRVTMLNEAATLIGRNLNADNVSIFHDAATLLQRRFNQDTVSIFMRAVQGLASLGNLSDAANNLRTAANAPSLRNLDDLVSRLEQAVRRLPPY
ncbi:HNH endonuclease signature motif containing protein [Actinomycetes bacterium KLBMP 9759]